MIRDRELVHEMASGRTVLVLSSSGDTLLCSWVDQGRYVVRELRTSAVVPVHAAMCRRIDREAAACEEARAHARQEEISARLARQRERKLQEP